MRRGKAEGIIINIRPSGEADLVLRIFTPGQGPVRAVARKALRSTRRFGGRILLFNHLLFDYSRRSDDYLYFIEDTQLAETFPGIFSDPVNFGKTALFSELALAAWGEGEPGERPYRFLLEFLRRAEEGAESPDRYVLDAFELLGILGHRPVLDVCASCGGKLGPSRWYSVNEGGTVCAGCAEAERFRLADRGTPPVKVSVPVIKTLSEGFKTPEKNLNRVKFSKKSRAEAENLWKNHVRALLGRTPKSMRYLDEMAG